MANKKYLIIGVFIFLFFNFNATTINKNILEMQLNNPYDVAEARLFFCNNLIIAYYITLAKNPEELIFLCSNYINNKNEIVNLVKYIVDENNFNLEESINEDNVIQELPNNTNNLF